MSPEIRINGRLVADVPDETGDHQMLDGSPLHVDVSGIEASRRKQVLILEGPAIGGRRVIRLTQEGKGNTANPKRNGDGKEPALEVLLREHPIRVTYSPRVKGTERLVITPYGGPYVGYQRGNRVTRYNPRWGGQGQR